MTTNWIGERLGVPVSRLSIGFLKNYTSDPPSSLHFQEAPRGRWHQWHRDWFSIRIRYLLISLTGWDPSAVYVCILCLLFLTQFSEEAKLQKFPKNCYFRCQFLWEIQSWELWKVMTRPVFCRSSETKDFWRQFVFFWLFSPPPLPSGHPRCVRIREPLLKGKAKYSWPPH